MLIDDYVNYQNIYKQKYGKAIVLYQNGSFYEIYNIDENDNELAKICELLNIQHTRKNKSILQISKSNPALAGVPLASLKKYLNVLLNNNYTVVLVEQVTDPPNPKRDVTNIYSPSTYIDNINVPYSNIIISLYISQEYCMKSYKKVFIYSLCNIDITTGKYVGYQPGQRTQYTPLTPEAQRTKDLQDKVANLNSRFGGRDARRFSVRGTDIFDSYSGQKYNG
jgi:DNA mismatch repair protein MutS